MPNHDGMNEPTPEISFEGFREAIRRAHGKTYESINDVGCLLLRARKTLKKESYQELLDQLGFLPRTAQRYIRIHKDERLKDPSIPYPLPGSWDTLYTITQLKDHEFELALEYEVIHPDVTQNEIETFKQAIRNNDTFESKTDRNNDTSESESETDEMSLSGNQAAMETHAEVCSILLKKNHSLTQELRDDITAKAKQALVPDYPDIIIKQKQIVPVPIDDPRIQEILKWKRTIKTFPYTNLSLERIKATLIKLSLKSSKKAWHSVEKNVLDIDYLGSGIARTFQKHMHLIKCSRGNSESPSEMDVWLNDNLLAKALHRASHVMEFQPTIRFVKTAISIFSEAHHVSSLRVMTVKAVFEKYLEGTTGNVILSPFAGFGGDLLGAMITNRKLISKFVGVEASRKTVLGLHKMVREFGWRRRSRIIHGVAEDILTYLEKDSVNLCFFSPPYFHHEQYANEETQSFKRYKTRTEWMGFMQKVMEDCFVVTKDGGYIIVNIAESVPTYSNLSKDFLAMCGKVLGLELVDTLRMLLTSKPGAGTWNKSSNSNTRPGWQKSEPIFVFRVVKKANTNIIYLAVDRKEKAA